MPSTRIAEKQVELNVKNCMKKLAVRKYASFSSCKIIQHKSPSKSHRKAKLKKKFKHKNSLNTVKSSNQSKQTLNENQKKTAPINTIRLSVKETLQLFPRFSKLDEPKKSLVESNQFKIRAKRILPNGQCQYLIEWP